MVILSRSPRPVPLVALGYIALTLAYTWPLPRHLFDGVPHDLGDPILNAWILWWSTKAVPLTTSWWNVRSSILRRARSHSPSTCSGLAPLTAPLILLTGNPLFAYNIVLLASCTLRAGRILSRLHADARSHDASFVAGLAFAFAPYRLAQPHIRS